jgi:hypothetical protein
MAKEVEMSLSWCVAQSWIEEVRAVGNGLRMETLSLVVAGMFAFLLFCALWLVLVGLAVSAGLVIRRLLRTAGWYWSRSTPYVVRLSAFSEEEVKESAEPKAFS